jgi:hypothetical protein
MIVSAAAVVSGVVVLAGSPTAGAAPHAQHRVHAYVLGVTALSPHAAWAVGIRDQKRTFVEHWNGSAWHIQSSPNVRKYNYLNATSATTTHDVWAVGYSQGSLGCTRCSRSLIEHWNGQRWKVVKSPNVNPSSYSNILYGVAALSANNVWAVGIAENDHVARHLVMHWNGHGWSLKATGVGKYTWFEGVGAASRTDVVAVGNGSAIDRWNGSRWRAQGGDSNDDLRGVTVPSTTTAWAAGATFGTSTPRPVVHRYAGGHWHRIVLGHYTNGQLAAAASSAPDDVWFVGDIPHYAKGTDTPLIVHWNGSALSRVPAPHPDYAQLSAVSADSATDAWAVGASSGSLDRPFFLHWKGTRWSRVS